MSRDCRALEKIVPVCVSVAALRGDLPDTRLLAEEAAAVRSAVESRRREFTTGRACARMALGRWISTRQAIPAGPNGEPRWPAGYVGSITHCVGYRGCAVARVDDLVTIGIDAEPNVPLPDGVLADVAPHGEERAWLHDLERRLPSVSWDRLLFCMKEAVYKAWAPVAERALDFEDAVVSVDPGSASFRARLRPPGLGVARGRLTSLPGKWAASDGILLTAVAIPQPSYSMGIRR